jgi:addiction module HigA family antidote
MTTKDNRRNLISHPGEILKNEFLEPLNISVYALANAIGVPRTRLNDIVLKRRGISADTALRLARFFDMTPNYWLNIQTHYDLVMAETEPENTLSKVLTLKDIKTENAIYEAI